MKFYKITITSIFLCFLFSANWTGAAADNPLPSWNDTKNKKAIIAFDDNYGNKPVGINHHVGRRPIAAFGNSDADFEMLEWVTEGDGLRLAAFVHHTDGKREWAYDRDSKIVGKLDKGLDEAPKRGWLLIDMKKDWKRIYSFEK